MGEGQRVYKCQRHPFRSDLGGLADTKTSPCMLAGREIPLNPPFPKGEGDGGIKNPPETEVWGGE